MTTFEDGPAKGEVLQLRTTPFFLRVTECDGHFDGLDQSEDKPRREEKVHVYEWASKPMGQVHIRPGGFFGMAHYKIGQEQPPDDVVRDNVKWRAWCDANVEGKRRYEFFMSIK